jgi:hypothetical protein
MSVIIVSIIVGLFAGAVGSVLGPVVTHLLGRRGRKEERERGIHGELRLMVEQRLGDCDEAFATVFGILVHLDAGHSPLDAYNRSMARRWDRSKDRPLLRWEPHRIEDEVLRAVAEELHHNLREFDSYLLSVTSADPKEWRAEIQERERQIERLQRQVKLRLDELRW